MRRPTSLSRQHSHQDIQQSALAGVVPLSSVVALPSVAALAGVSALPSVEYPGRCNNMTLNFQDKRDYQPVYT
jgi:hypothetical protein